MYIISIDIGFEHMGIIGAQVFGNYTLDSVTFCKLVNIKKLVTECSDSQCNLKHDLCITDYMCHFFKIHAEHFDTATHILIERQPPKGFIAVQELIVYRYRNKTILVSPNSIHKHFTMPKIQTLRKMFTVCMANKRLSKFFDYENSPRKHDMSDAYCQLMYFLNTKIPSTNSQKDIPVTEYEKELESFAYLGD
jgi:hypothetical protein